MTKKITNLKKTKSGWKPINVSALERMRQPSYRYINKGLTLDATPLEKSKYEICQDILRYAQKNKISDQDLKKSLGVKQTELDYLLYCHIERFSLDELVQYASKLFAPFYLGIVPEKSLIFSHKTSNVRARKHA